MSNEQWMGKRLRARFHVPAILALVISVFPAPQSSAATQHPIDVRNFAFTPAALRATKGDNVKWSVTDWGTCHWSYNYETFDCGGHDITTYGGDASFASGKLTNGERYMEPFNGGTVLYRCTLHSSLYNGVCTSMCGAMTDRTGPPLMPAFTYPLDGAILSVDSLASGGGVYYKSSRSVEIRGAAEPWVIVTLYDGAAVVGSAGVGASGQWTIPATLSPGLHTIFIRARDVLGLTTDSMPRTIDIRGAPATDFTVSIGSGTLSPEVVHASVGQSIKWLGLQTDSYGVIGYGGTSDMTSGPNSTYLPIYVKTFGGGTALYRTVDASVSSAGVCTGACGAITDRTGPPLAPEITYPVAGSFISSTSIAISVRGEPWTIVSVYDDLNFLGKSLLVAGGTASLPSLTFRRGLHNLRVHAQDVDGRTADGTTITFKVHLPPDSPTGLFGTRGPDPGMIRLRWNPLSDIGNEAGYRIYRAEPGGAFALLTQVPFGVNGFDDTGLPEGGFRNYRVTAFNDAGEGLPSGQITGQAPSRPGPPRSLTAFASTRLGQLGAVLLNWGPPDSSGGIPLTAYRIYRATFRTDYALLATSGLYPTYIDFECGIGICSYKVVAVNLVGDGVFSNEASFLGIKPASNSGAATIR